MADDDTRAYDRSAGTSARTWALVAAVLTLFATASAASTERVSHVERRLFDAINGLGGVVRLPLWFVMQAGTLSAVAIAAAASGMRAGRRPAITIASAGAFAYGAALALKHVIGRGRPRALLVAAHRFTDETNGGFPSGHSAVAFALATASLPLLPRRGRIAAIVVAVTVAFARVYFGAHFPLDAIGGAALGAVAGLGADAIRRRPSSHPS